jgi:ADP-heptose:LPS heptosyltransferase
MNIQQTNYCIQDLPERAIHRNDKHIINQICEHYGINDADLKCELYFSEQEEEEANNIIKNLPDDFVLIEPISKTNYTVNRAYPFDKWQYVVDAITKNIQVVQVGLSENQVLDNVINLVGKTTFRTASIIMRQSKFLLSSEGGLTHAATAVETPAIVVITGYQTPKMVAYSQNTNINIATHGPCGMKSKCVLCVEDSRNHNHNKIIDAALAFLD